MALQFNSSTVEPKTYGPNEPGHGIYALPGNLHYNGIDFPNGSKIQATMTPEYTTSGMQIKYMTYRVELNTIIFTDSYAQSANLYTTSDRTLEAIRAQLSVPGGRLKFKNLGFGTDLDIEARKPALQMTAARGDVVYGPKPEVLSWTPMASGKTCSLRWSCTVSIPWCMNSDRDILEFEWSTSWSFHDGLTIRRTSGTLETVSEIVKTGNLFHINKDASKDHRQTVLDTILLPKRFRRTDSFDLSADRRKLLFNITDTEIDSREAFTPGIMDEDVTYTFENTKPRAFSAWSHNLSGTIKVSPSHPKIWAWYALARYWEDRHKHLEDFGATAKHTGGSYYEDLVQDGKIVTPRSIPTKIHVADNLNKNTMNFSLSWTYTLDLRHILQASGFLQVSDRDKNNDRWDEWRATMQDSQYSMDGHKAPYSSGGSYDLEDDTPTAIINICTPTRPNPVLSSPGDEVNPIIPDTPVDESKPESYSGYLDWYPTMEILENGNTVVRHTLSDPDTSEYQEEWLRGPHNPAHRPENFFNQGTSFLPKTAKYQQDHNPISIQKRLPATYTLRLTGYGTRVGLSSPFPVVEGIREGSNYHQPQLLRKRVKVIPVARNSPWVIYQTMWDVEYALTSPPAGDILDPKNVRLVGDGYREGIM